jgi:hypothetical protein
MTYRPWCLLVFVSSSSPAGESPVRVAARRPGSRLAARPGNGPGRSQGHSQVALRSLMDTISVRPRLSSERPRLHLFTWIERLHTNI